MKKSINRRYGNEKTKSFKVHITIVVAVTIMILPAFSNMQAASQTSNLDNCGCEEEVQEGSDPSQVLEGEDKISYLQVLEDSKLYQDKVSSKGVDKETSQVIHMISNKDTNNTEVAEFILVAGNELNDNESSFWGIIDINTNEVKRIIHLDFDSSNEEVIVKDYNYNGNLVNSTQVTFNEIENGEFDIASVSPNDGVGLQANPWWYAWACNFSSGVACAAGCVAWVLNPVAYSTCTFVCGVVFSSSACSNA